MDEQANRNCIIPEHQAGTLNMACINEDCQSVRYGCLMCIQEFHNEHVKDVKEFPVIQKWIKKLEQQWEKVSTEIEYFLTVVNSQLNKLQQHLKGRMDQFKKFPNALTLTDLNIVIYEISYYSDQERYNVVELISHEMKQFIRKINFGTLLIENNVLTLKQKNAKREEIKRLFQDNKYQKCLNTIEEYLLHDPCNDEVLHQKAIILHNNNQLSQAILIYEEILERLPKVKESKLKYDLIQKHRILSIIRNQKYNDALKICKQLLEVEPDNQYYLEMKANSLLHLNQFDEALIIFLALEEQQQLNPEIKYMLGETVLKLNDKVKALEYFKQADLYGYPDGELIQKKIDTIKSKM